MINEILRQRNAGLFGVLRRNAGLMMAVALALGVGILNVAGASEAGAATGRQLEHRTSWVGNTFGQGGVAWVQNWVNDIAVFPDGTVYTNTE